VPYGIITRHTSSSCEMRPSDMTSVERSQYETEVLASVDEFMRPGESGFYEFRGAALEGEYPDTRITIRYWNFRLDREESRSYSIWGELVGSDGELEYPAPHAAVLLKTWALGG
jgi:hypothetical protein